MKRVLIIVVVVAVVGVGGVVAFMGGAIPVEMMQVKPITVREFVTEDAKTRLADEFIVDMPVSGTLKRMQIEVGDHVEKGQVVAHIDPYDLKQEIRKIEAHVAQKKAQVAGVDVAKVRAMAIRRIRSDNAAQSGEGR